MPIDYRWEPPSLRERERSYAWIWIVLLILVIGIIVYFAVQNPSSVQQVQSVQQPVTSSEASTEQAKPVFKSAAPEFDSHCTVVGGVIAESIARTGNIVSFIFKNNGKVTIEGSYFEASNMDVKAYRKNSDSLAPGAEVKYSVDLDDVSKDVGLIAKSFVVIPIQNSKACFNQRMIVIK